MGADQRGSDGISRRSALTGVGAALLGTSIAAVREAPAGAAPPDTEGVAAPSVSVAPATSPITTTIASAPTSAYIYRVVCMYDFEPFNPAAQKTWGGSGVYPAGVGTSMRATLDIPPGCLIREVEYYVYNNSGGNVYPDTFIYVPGFGAISSIGASVAMASTPTVAAATATVVQQGPYPLGARLLVSASLPSNGSVQINGARVAFTGAASGVGTRGEPERVYDSRHSGGKLGAGGTRLITLPTSLFAPGMMGLIANVTVLDAARDGVLTVFRADVAQPAAPTMHYGLAETTDQITVQVSATGQIKVHTTEPVHVVVDAIGVLG